MIVGVIGSGSIGPDLAYGFLSALAAGEGGKVYLLDIKKEALDAGVGRIEGYIGKALARGRMSQKAAEATRAALIPTMDIKDLAGCDYVLEAATEDLKTKRSNSEKSRKGRPAGLPHRLCHFRNSESADRRRGAASRAMLCESPVLPGLARAARWRLCRQATQNSAPACLKCFEKLGKVPIITADVPCFCGR